MIRQCGWCGMYMGEKEPLSDYSVTTGICEPCRDKMLAEAGLLQIGSVAVVLADDDALEANAVAEIERLGFDPAEVLTA